MWLDPTARCILETSEPGICAEQHEAAASGAADQIKCVNHAQIVELSGLGFCRDSNNVPTIASNGLLSCAKK